MNFLLKQVHCFRLCLHIKRYSASDDQMVIKKQKNITVKINQVNLSTLSVLRLFLRWQLQIETLNI